MKKVGLLGGSFDPPHKGHLYASTYSKKTLKLKKVIWAITKRNPLKKNPFFSFDIRKKLPFEDNSIQACYSHMLYCMALTTIDLEKLNNEILRI